MSIGILLKGDFNSTINETTLEERESRRTDTIHIELILVKMFHFKVPIGCHAPIYVYLNLLYLK